MINIRKASVGDARSLGELNQAFNGVIRDTQEIEKALQANRSPETVLVADESGVVVGFACFQTLRSLCYEAPWTEIMELYVAPAHRRRGAGTALVREVLRRAEQDRASEVMLRTNVKNIRAKDFFAQLGLKPAPHVVFHGTLEPA